MRPWFIEQQKQNRSTLPAYGIVMLPFVVCSVQVYIDVIHVGCFSFNIYVVLLPRIFKFPGKVQYTLLL
jgi:hypothetical protein